MQLTCSTSDYGPDHCQKVWMSYVQLVDIVTDRFMKFQTWRTTFLEDTINLGHFNHFKIPCRHFYKQANRPKKQTFTNLFLWEMKPYALLAIFYEGKSLTVTPLPVSSAGRLRSFQRCWGFLKILMMGPHPRRAALWLWPGAATRIFKVPRRVQCAAETRPTLRGCLQLQPLNWVLFWYWKWEGHLVLKKNCTD